MHIQRVIAETSDAMSLAQSFIPDFENFPALIQQAILESGIIEKGGDFDWLNDPRVIPALELANESHAGKLRKRGGKMRLIHEIRSAHRAFEISNHPLVIGELAKEGVTPIDVVLGQLFHDCIENFRSLALKTAGYFDPNPIYQRIENIVGAEKFKWLKEECLDYMTDNPSLEKAARIAAQRAKGYMNEAFCLSVVRQILRMVDKEDHVDSDADYCIEQAKWLRENNASAEDRAALQKEAAKCLEKSKLKSFVLEFPFAWAIELTYRRAQRILQRTANGDRDPSRIHQFGDFGDAALVMMRESTQLATSLWSDASRRSRPFFERMYKSVAASFTFF